jgi:uncharacterized protein
MSSAETEAIATTFFERLYAGEAERALDLLADDVVWWLIGNLPASGRYEGLEAVRRDLLEPFGPVWDGQPQSATIEHTIASGDHAVLELTGGGTTAHGNEYENFYCYVVRVRDGRIDRIRGYTDTGYALGLLWGPQRERPPID